MTEDGSTEGAMAALKERCSALEMALEIVIGCLPDDARQRIEQHAERLQAGEHPAIAGQGATPEEVGMAVQLLTGELADD